MPKQAFAVICLFLSGLVSASGGAPSEIKIHKIPGNSGRLTARVFYKKNRMYVEGRAYPSFWGTGRVSIKVDLKDDQGNVLATKTDTSEETGRPQILKMFGIFYEVDFDAVPMNKMAAIDVSYAR